jgi:glycerate kinase
MKTRIVIEPKKGASEHMIEILANTIKEMIETMKLKAVLRVENAERRGDCPKGQP